MSYTLKKYNSNVTVFVGNDAGVWGDFILTGDNFTYDESVKDARETLDCWLGQIKDFASDYLDSEQLKNLLAECERWAEGRFNVWPWSEEAWEDN